MYSQEIAKFLKIPSQPDISTTTRQKEALGKYYHVTLPEHPVTRKPDLRLLYQTTLPQEEIEKIIQLIIQNKDAETPQVAAFLGPPGCGKVYLKQVNLCLHFQTSALFQIAMKKYVTFFDCQTAGLGDDTNYFTMCSDIRILPKCTDVDNFEGWHRNNLEKAKERISLEYCARRIHLLLLVIQFPSLQPKQYLESQLNGGKRVIENVANILKSLDPDSIYALLKIVDEELKQKGVEEKAVAIDEAGAAQYELGDRIVSESALKSGILQPNLKGQFDIPRKYQRGILGALTRTLLERGGITSL
jgi:hypothetical protein